VSEAVALDFVKKEAPRKNCEMLRHKSISNFANMKRERRFACTGSLNKNNKICTTLSLLIYADITEKLLLVFENTKNLLSVSLFPFSFFANVSANF